MDIKKLLHLVLIVILTTSAYYLGKRATSVTPRTEMSLQEIYAAPDLPILKIGDKIVTESELTRPVQIEYHGLKKQLYDFQYNLIRQYMVDNFLRTAAELNNQDFNTYVDSVVKGKIKIEEKDITKWIKDNNVPETELSKNPEIKQQIQQALYQTKEEEFLKQYVLEQMGDTPVSLYISKPKLTVELALESLIGSPQWGRSEAPVSITYFGDFECPFCKQLNVAMDAAKKKHPKDIKIFFKQLPSPNHPGAIDLAMASLCANEQEQFWNFHDYAFSQLNLQTGVETILSYPKHNKQLKETPFRKCMMEQKYKKNIETDLALARYLGLQSTPFIVINGEAVSGAISSEELDAIISRHLKD